MGDSRSWAADQEREESYQQELKEAKKITAAWKADPFTTVQELKTIKATLDDLVRSAVMKRHEFHSLERSIEKLEKILSPPEAKAKSR